MQYVIGDTETAGLGSSKKVCEIGLLAIDPLTLEVLEEVGSLIDPQIPIEPGAQSIHGISDEMVADAPTMDEFIQLTLGGPIDGEITLICHNVPFDKPLLEPIGNITRSICTLFESRQIQTRLPGLENCKLQTLREYFGIPANAAHRALDDCEITRQLLIRLVDITGRSLEELASATDRTVLIMPFGKHQGTPILQLPRQYLNWALDNMDLESNLKSSMEKALALK